MSYKVANKIYETSNYNIFVPHKGNRNDPSFKRHVDRLGVSMCEHSFLDGFPIVVKPRPRTKKFDIIDGHHRLLAAKQLEIPVKFVILNGEVSADDIYLVNTTQQPWRIIDYVRSYARAGHKEYAVMLSMIEKYHVSPSTVGAFLMQQSPSAAVIKNRALKIVDEQWAHEHLQELVEMKKTLPHAIKRAFVTCFIKALKHPDFNSDNFVRNIRKYGRSMVMDVAKIPDMAAEFETVYNHHRQRRIPLCFIITEQKS